MCRDVSCWLLVQICVKDMCCRQFLPRSSGRFQGKFSKVNKKDPNEMIFILIRNWRHFVIVLLLFLLAEFSLKSARQEWQRYASAFHRSVNQLRLSFVTGKIGKSAQSSINCNSSLIGNEAKEWVHISVLLFSFFAQDFEVGSTVLVSVVRFKSVTALSVIGFVLSVIVLISNWRSLLILQYSKDQVLWK